MNVVYPFSLGRRVLTVFFFIFYFSFNSLNAKNAIIKKPVNLFAEENDGKFGVNEWK